uniref:Uncharacterized protein n=1 Tax=Glossina morsitans morsitans TaxID=37546 RepID=A0A1B0FGX9_GLOMM
MAALLIKTCIRWAKRCSIQWNAVRSDGSEVRSHSRGKKRSICAFDSSSPKLTAAGCLIIESTFGTKFNDCRALRFKHFKLVSLNL